VSRFARRTPVGSERTLTDQYRYKASQLSWPVVIAAACGAAFILWTVDFDTPWRLVEGAHVGMAILSILALAVLKIVDRRH